MNNEDLFRAVGEADDSAFEDAKKRSANRKRLIAGLAAAALLTVGAAVLIMTKPWEKGPSGNSTISPQAIPMMCNEPGVTPDPFVKPVPRPGTDVTPDPRWFSQQAERPVYKNAN